MTSQNLFYSWKKKKQPPTPQAITTGGVTYREQPWHKECFVCTGCKKQLSGQRFTSRDEFAYCLSCFCNLYAKKCAGCTNPISGRCLTTMIFRKQLILKIFVSNVVVSLIWETQQVSQSYHILNLNTFTWAVFGVLEKFEWVLTLNFSPFHLSSREHVDIS